MRQEDELHARDGVSIALAHGPAEWTCSARTSAYSCQEPTQAFRDKTRFVYDKWANDIKFFVARSLPASKPCLFFFAPPINHKRINKLT
jgi:hypothetical protein